MTEAAERIAAGRRAYDVCIEASGRFSGLIGRAHHDGVAYVLWAEVGDLLDSPRGPQSESACSDMAAAVAEDWLSINTESSESVSSYFERWCPGKGSAWLAHDRESAAQPSAPGAS